MNYLALLSSHNLALLSDWLEETGELYVDLYLKHSGGSSTAFFIRSITDLKGLLFQQDWHEISLSVFRRLQYPLRGVANEQLLALALQQIPDGQPYDIVRLSYYPDNCAFCGSGKSHAELRGELTEEFGERVGIGQEPPCLYAGRCDPDAVFEVNIQLKNQSLVRRNQDFYERYAKNPQRYQLIEKLWLE